MLLKDRQTDYLLIYFRNYNLQLTNYSSPIQPFDDLSWYYDFNYKSVMYGYL